MSDPTPQLVGLVIRPDGTVPFDEDCHPAVRGAILAHLAEKGVPFSVDEHGVHRIHDHHKHLHKL